MIKLSPISQMRWQRFKNNKRGFYSLILFSLITLICLCAELFCNSKALIVKYNGDYFFPVFSSKEMQWQDFGIDKAGNVDYLVLKEQFKEKDNNFVLMTIIPYSPEYLLKKDTDYVKESITSLDKEMQQEINKVENSTISLEEKQKQLHELKIKFNKKRREIEQLNNYPLPPNFSKSSYLGTNTNGQDIVSWLIYGYRKAIVFSLLLLVITYAIGVSIGCMMGYFGSWFDIIVQRVIEILSNIPFLYIVMITGAILKENDKTMGFWYLLLIFILFNWMGITWYMRTVTYREKARDYILAAKTISTPTHKIILSHILPNVMSLLITFIPFSISSSITALTSLDYLGYGLPIGEASWGALLKMGLNNMETPWVATSIVVALVSILLLINNIGESIRDAFDPKKITRFE